MTSLMTRSVIMSLCVMIIVLCRAEDLPVSFMDFSAILNGDFINFDRDKDDVGDHDRIEIIVKPALAPGLQQDPVMYAEEIVNGDLYRMVVVVMNKSSNDHILYLTYYNFTNHREYKPGTFNTDDLVNLRREDFHIREGCQAAYRQVSPGTLLGDWIDCRHTINGKHPSYTVTLTCDDFRMIAPLASYETTTRKPYDLKHRGLRYPLIGAPKGYVSPCKDSH